ncbi:MAG TPA: S8 family serine peptidase [archaeon]|nr:S8 family serine peptidase [archaeon]
MGAARKILFVLILLLPFELSTGSRLEAFEPAASRMSDRLYQTLTYGESNEMISVILYLVDDLDIYSLDNSLTLAAAGKKKRYSTVVGALLASAEKTQALLLKLLNGARASGDVLSYQSFWINNSIAVTGKISFISALSIREEIEWMTHDMVYFRKDPVEKSAELFQLPNPDSLRARSYPIRTLGLEALWDRGLTGKGILICDIGSGIDGKHPLLAPKWRGNNGGTAAESWFDPIDGTTLPFDDERNSPSHDTGVTGIMVAGERSLGVAYDAQWIGAKVFDNQNLTDEGMSSTKDSYIIAAFQWALDPDGNPETVVDVPDVINSSWGTLGEFNEDICRKNLWGLIDRIEAAGTVMVFSAGNEGPDPFTIGSPASRTRPADAFAVGAVDSEGRIASFSSRGPSACDSTSIKPNICAPGSNIITIVSSEYLFALSRVNGTSFAAPYVSGIIALMKQANPTLTPDEIKNLIAGTAVDGGQSGPDYAYGYGIINPAGIFERLQTPDHPVLYTKRVIIDDTQGGNGNGYLEQGETIRMMVPVFNAGTDIEGVSSIIRTEKTGIRMIDSTAFYGDIPQFDGRSNEDDPFLFEIHPDAEAGSQLLFYLHLSSADQSYRESIQVTLPIAPAVEGLALHDAGSFFFSFTNYGQFGGNIGLSRSGAGLRYPKDAPYTMLYRGALVLGTSSLKVSDGIADFDFAPAPGGPIKILSDSPRADQVGVAYIREKTEGALNAIGVRLKQTTLVWSEAPYNDFVILEYQVHNPYQAAIKNFYIGLYADWDIPDSLPSRNAVGYNETLRLGYTYNPLEPQFGYGGLALISGQEVSGHRAVSNWRYIHEGYSDYLAFGFMSGGLSFAASDSLDDWSEILATGPYTIPAGDSLTVAWALLLGDDLADLIANTQAAVEKYRASLTLASGAESRPAEVATRLPRSFELAQNAPNPFNPSTTISYNLPREEKELHVRLTVFDLRGRKVAELVDATQGGGSYSVTWNGTDSQGRPLSSGVYFYRITAGDYKAVRKMVLIK